MDEVPLAPDPVADLRNGDNILPIEGHDIDTRGLVMLSILRFSS